MSSTLVMFPAYPSEKETLSDELKIILRKRFNGSLKDLLLTEDDLPYLDGLYDGGANSALKLINYIKKHKYVQLNEEY